MTSTLDIGPSPHLASGASVDAIMRDVAVALLPVTVFAIHQFGLAALLALTVALGACVIAERLLGSRRSVSDWSAVVTGLIFGLTLPPGLPLWMTALGSVVAIAAGKMLFGGLGNNPFNPALVGRAFLQAAFPITMTTWLAPGAADRFVALPSSSVAWPFAAPVYDGLSGATPLAAWKFGNELTNTTDLVLGTVSGSTGETSTLLILAGAAYLFVRRLADWRIPVAMLGAAAFVAVVCHTVDPDRYPNLAFVLCSGGLMFGAVFMATDVVASPLTAAGAWVYGAFIGVLTIIIRFWGGLPEGVMYAILMGNAVSPLIDRWIQPRVYGTGHGMRTGMRP